MYQLSAMHVMLVRVREELSVWARATDMKRSFLRNIRVVCDVDRGSRGNFCLCVSWRGEEQLGEECSCGM